MTPTEFFQHAADHLAAAAACWRACLGLAVLIYIYRFPFRWESLLVVIGLSMIVVAPWLPGVATIGEIIFWPGALGFVVRQYNLNHETFVRNRPSPVARPIAAYTADVIKNTFIK